MAQNTKVTIGTKVNSIDNKLEVTLSHRTQAYRMRTEQETDRYDSAINSPKSVIFHPTEQKYYVESLEGYKTVVFDAQTHLKIKEIQHSFFSGAAVFKNNESTLFDYTYPETIKNPNQFSGKPVESCISPNGKWLFVPYYRRSFDKNAQFPSAMAIISTEKDEIVRVMPTAPLPKMVAVSPDGKWLAVTHWGDNTVGIIDISSDQPMDFKYQHLLEVDKRIKLDLSQTEIVDRDNNCGNCLRGTTFTPDSKYLLVAKMGGNGDIGIFRTVDFSKVGNILGLKVNIRHLVVDEENIYMSVNKSGHVDKVNWQDVRYHFNPEKEKKITVKVNASAFVGSGARTIAMDPKKEYMFAAVNNACKIVAIRMSDWKVVLEIAADPFPVGLAVSPDGKQLIATAQGKENNGGNSVMIYTLKRK